MKRPNFPSTQQQQQRFNQSNDSTTTDSNQILVESVYKECPFHLIRTEWFINCKIKHKLIIFNVLFLKKVLIL